MLGQGLLNLCHVCHDFQIQPLYESICKKVRNSKPIASTVGGFSIYTGNPEFYQHHRDLWSLFAASEKGCLLCKSIWQQSSVSLGIDPQNLDTALSNNAFGEQIFLGLSDWSPEAQGMPYLVAVQDLPKGAVRNLATFEVSVAPGHAPKGFEDMLARDVQPDPASEASLAVAKGWHEQCLANHSKCSHLTAQKRPLPTRVIDVGNTQQNPRLITTSGRTGVWAALSYCWGGESSFILNEATSNSFFNGQNQLNQYPQTLRDAITITRSLGIPYLWIDALCIQQDTPTDWAFEAARMKDVYGGATLTITATNSSTTNAGIFHQRLISPNICQLAFGSFTVSLRLSTQFSDTTLKSEVLNTRGWTLQESILSPRVLSYASQQMVWECQTLKIGESGRPVLPGERHRDKAFVQKIVHNDVSFYEKAKYGLARLSLKALPIGYTLVPESWETGYEACYSRWFAIVKDFTGRNLTVQADILPALSGLAAAFQNLVRDKYVAGLWRRDIVRGMCWSRTNFPHRNPAAIAAGNKGRKDFLPSWSWASIIDGRVFNSLEEENSWPLTTLEETASCVDVHVEPKFADPFGQINGAWVMIKAPFRYIQDPAAAMTLTPASEDPVLNERVREELCIRTSRNEYLQQHQPHPGQKFAVLRLMMTTRVYSSTVDNGETRLPGASILMVETTGSGKRGDEENAVMEEKLKQGRRGEGQNGKGRKREKAKEEWRRIGFFSLSVPAFPDEEDISKRLLEEMSQARWEWRAVKLV